MLSLHEIERALDHIRPDLRDIALELRNLAAEVAPGVTEKLYGDGMAYYYAERGGTVSAGVCMIHLLPDHVRLAFPQGAFLPDPHGLLEGAPRYKQHVRIYCYEDAPWDYLRELLVASVRFRWQDLAIHPTHLPTLTRRDQYAFFRMGIVTGLAEPGQVAAWADAELLATPDPDYELVELSLAGRSPHSQMLYLLSRLQGLPVYETALGMILARARLRLAEDPGRAADLVLNLRLLAVEDKLPQSVKTALLELDAAREDHRGGCLAVEVLRERMAVFLEPYAVYTPLLAKVFPKVQE